MIKKIFFLLLLISFNINSKAENSPVSLNLSDSTQISLLTSYPWEGAVYAIYGHTGLRIQDFKNNGDIVFNYGLFDFNSPNFMFRFVKGETDYIVGAVPYRYYFLEYQERGEPLIEQVLNLTEKEKQDLWNALLINCQPQNREYRYNFMFDNCATRIRDIIEKNVDGTIEYSATNKEQTFRDLLNEFTSVQPWTRFGVNLIIGNEADGEATDRQKMFLPIYMMKAYSDATIKNQDGERKLVTSENLLISKSDEGYFSVFSPLVVGFILLLLTMVISFLAIKKGYLLLNKIYSFLLFLIAGLGGCIIFFLIFFSVHPATSPNWNIIWLNPFQLLFSIFFFFKFASRAVYYYHFINFVALTLFLLAWFLIPQQLEIAFIPYILSIGLCSFTNICLYRRSLRDKLK